LWKRHLEDVDNVVNSSKSEAWKENERGEGGSALRRRSNEGEELDLQLWKRLVYSRSDLLEN